MRAVRSSMGSSSAAPGEAAGSAPVLRLHLGLRLANLGAIATAWGEDAARVVLASVFEGLCGLGNRRHPAHVRSTPQGDGFYLVLGLEGDEEGAAPAPAGLVGEAAAMARIVLGIAALACRPIRVSGAFLVPALAIDDWRLSAAQADGTGERVADGLDARQAAFAATFASLSDASPSRASAALWRDRMAAAADIIAAEPAVPRAGAGTGTGIGTGTGTGTVLGWEPVWSVPHDTAVWYTACPLALSARGERRGAGADLRALAGLGLDRPLVLRRAMAVLDRLALHPALCLGLSVPLSSARSDLWWAPVLTRLRQAPAQARRLFVEIDASVPAEAAEGAAPGASAAASPVGGSASGPVSGTVALADDLRRLGCRVVLSGFGADSAPGLLLALRPDAVKLDPLCIRLAGASERQARIFHHLAGLAKAVAGTVIATGVDTAAQSDLALSEGIDWQQGAWLRSPSLRLPAPLHASGEGRP